MDDIEATLDQQSTEAQRPAEVAVVSGPQIVHRHAAGLDRRHQGVLRRQHVGEFVVEGASVSGCQEINEETFGPPVAHALDNEEHPRTGPQIACTELPPGGHTAEYSPGWAAIDPCPGTR